MNVRTLPLPKERQETRGGTLDWLDWLLAAVCAIGFVVALYAAFVYAPTEAVQGDVQRIFYFHVSLAWLAYLAFFVVFVSFISGSVPSGGTRWHAARPRSASF